MSGRSQLACQLRIYTITKAAAMPATAQMHDAFKIRHGVLVLQIWQRPAEA